MNKKSFFISFAFDLAFAFSLTAVFYYFANKIYGLLQSLSELTAEGSYIIDINNELSNISVQQEFFRLFREVTVLVILFAVAVLSIYLLLESFAFFFAIRGKFFKRFIFVSILFYLMVVADFLIAGFVSRFVPRFISVSILLLLLAGLAYFYLPLIARRKTNWRSFLHMSLCLAAGFAVAYYFSWMLPLAFMVIVITITISRIIFYS